MSLFSQVMFVLGLIILVCSVLGYFYYFVLQRNALMTNRGINLILTIMIILAGIALVIYYTIVFPESRRTDTIQILLFIMAIMYSVVGLFAMGQANSIKHRTVEVLETIVGVLEAGDPNLKGHSLHVLNLTMLFYQYLPLLYRIQLNEDDLRLAALFLDLGKLGIPAEIRNRSGKLGEEEYALMKNHPECAVKILESIGSFDRVSEWILYHHERFDGRGNRELKGKQIPLASRMIFLTDTYSAMIMNRSYKASMDYEDAVAELRMVAGTQLDAELVHIFCEIPLGRIRECMEEVSRKMGVFKIIK